MSTEPHTPRLTFRQRRLRSFGLWGFVALLGGLLLRSALAASLDDTLEPLEAAGHAAASFALLGVWAALRGRVLGARALAAVDVLAMNAVAAGFCLMALHLPLVAHPREVLLLALTFTFTLRATFVPSRVRQTVLVHATAFAWIAVTAFYLAAKHRAADPSDPEGEVRGHLITFGVWWFFNSGAAVAATSVIYGLRREVREAMQLGQYTLESKIGAGGMGTVYQARHAMLRRPTAVKLLPPSHSDPVAVARFEREVQRTAELSHPNVVTVFDYGHTPDGILYYAMERLDGLDLRQLVSTHGALEPARAVHVLMQICDGLAAAHETGLLHRDIKPANVFLLRGGRTADLVKLVDFGLVKEMDGASDAAAEDPDAAAVTGEQSIVGTPATMAPEAVTAPADVDERSDLYGVGAVGYYVLTGRHVFEASSVMEVLAMQLHAAPPPLSVAGLPEGLEEILLRCLAKDPDDRPASAAELRDLLASLEDLRPWRLEDAQRWWSSRSRAPSERATSRRRAALAETVPEASLSIDLASRFPPR